MLSRALLALPHGGSNGWATRPPLDGVAKRYFSDPTTPDDEPRFLEMVKMNFEKAAKHTDLTPGLVKQIMACNSVLRISFPIERVNYVQSLILLIFSFACARSFSLGLSLSFSLPL